MESKKIIIKPLSLKELIVSLERLARFQYPYKKQERVYREILTRNTVSPKISLRNYYDFPLGIINNLVQLIWNTSIEVLNGTSNSNYTLNAYLSYEDIQSFYPSTIMRDIFSSNNIKYSKYPELFDKKIDNNLLPKIITVLNDNGFNISTNPNLRDLDILSKAYILYNMSFPLNISGLLNIIEREVEDNLNPVIKRLIWLNNLEEIKKTDINDENIVRNLNIIFNKAQEHRKKALTECPVSLLILAEGATEEKLLPIFADKLGINFAGNGIHLIAAGGKNQVARLYKDYYKKVKLPILIILDADAQEIALKIKKILRESDKIFLIQEGEFEDILPIDLICRSINKFHRMETHISPEEIHNGSTRVEILKNLWKEKGLGEFDKAKFAKIIAENIQDDKDISPTINRVADIIGHMINVL